VASSRPTPAVIYRVFDEIGGRQVPRYSNTRPPSGDYEVVAQLR